MRPDARLASDARASASGSALMCAWCGRPGRACDADTVPGGDQALAGLVLCAACEYLDGAGADLWDDEDLDAATEAAHEAFETGLRQRYRDDDRDDEHCWWCGRPADPLPLTARLDGEIAYEHPALCEVCEALSGKVSFGFENAQRAWASARTTLIETARAAG